MKNDLNRLLIEVRATTFDGEQVCQNIAPETYFAYPEELLMGADSVFSEPRLDDPRDYLEPSLAWETVQVSVTDAAQGMRCTQTHQYFREKSMRAKTIQVHRKGVELEDERQFIVSHEFVVAGERFWVVNRHGWRDGRLQPEAIYMWGGEDERSIFHFFKPPKAD